MTDESLALLQVRPVISQNNCNYLMGEREMKKLAILIALLTFTILIMTACSTSGGEQELAEELHVYNWSEYIDPEVYTAFEEEFGVKVIEDTFSSNEELLAKIQAGAAGFDLIVPSDYMVEIMIEEGLLTEINKDNIPNLSNLSDLFSDPPYDPGLVYCVPYQWGTTGIGYNSDEIE
ncbi:MAG: extracellular solute-binding protein, partial [Anaerolineales bacterium]|nr:extracellular solute-binding protein [Anaerolineales bacterium]